MTGIDPLVGCSGQEVKQVTGTHGEQNGFMGLKEHLHRVQGTSQTPFSGIYFRPEKQGNKCEGGNREAKLRKNDRPQSQAGEQTMHIGMKSGGL